MKRARALALFYGGKSQHTIVLGKEGLHVKMATARCDRINGFISKYEQGEIQVTDLITLKNICVTIKK